MTSSGQTEIDSARRVADQLLETSAGRQALLALDKARTLVERERGISDDNSDEVPSVQKELNAALTEIHAAIGADKVVLRQVVGFVLDKPRASDAEVERVLSRIEADPDATSEPQRRIVRATTMRAVTALGLLSQRITSFTAWSLFLGASGRGAVPGEVFAPSLVSGVDRDSGPFETLKTKLVDMTGYTAGCEGLPSTRRVPSAILRRARAAWRDMTRRSRTPIPNPR